MRDISVKICELLLLLEVLYYKIYRIFIYYSRLFRKFYNIIKIVLENE